MDDLSNFLITVHGEITIVGRICAGIVHFLLKAQNLVERWFLLCWWISDIVPLRKFDVSWVKRVFQNGRHLEPEVELQLNRKALIVSCLPWKRSWSRQRNLVLVYKQFCCNLEPQNTRLIQIHKIFKMAVTLNRKWCINRKITFICLENLFIFHFIIIILPLSSLLHPV